MKTLLLIFLWPVLFVARVCEEFTYYVLKKNVPGYAMRGDKEPPMKSCFVNWVRLWWHCLLRFHRMASYKVWHRDKKQKVVVTAHELYCGTCFKWRTPDAKSFDEFIRGGGWVRRD